MVPTTDISTLITRGEANLRNMDGGSSSGLDNPRDGCDTSVAGRTAGNCITAVAEEFSDLYRSGFVIDTALSILNAELSKTGETVSVDAGDSTAAAVVAKVEPAVERYYLSQLPPPADDDDDDAPWAEAIGGAIALSYFANYLIKQTTWQGNLFTYAMPTSNDTFAYGMRVNPNKNWEFGLNITDRSYAETPQDPYYDLKVEYRF